MRDRAQFAELIRAGRSDVAVARALRASRSTVAKIRRELNIPPTVRPAGYSPEDVYRLHARPLDGGHAEWTGPVGGTGVPMACWSGGSASARRIGFTLQHGRDPVGYVLPGCGRPGCVAQAHLEDRPMRAQLRTQLTSIFGGTS